MATIDQLDVEILSRLTDNARLGIAELASDLGVSRTTVNLRLKRLEDDGVLLGFRPVIDLAQIGAGVRASLSIEIDQRRMPQIVQQLAGIPEVLEVSIRAGREDLLAHVAIGSLEELQVLTSRIVEIAGVRRTTSMFTVSTPVAHRVLPLLGKLAAGRGWGRSTPTPR
ncbi:Lrp/AsnC family transcriptional regulator [Microbacterium marinilacus]|uniref:Lrp/AsnC family transcriptional regulator n=1 Tax=Microbacterium marinilacus TaxID=415209 RepID=A0ABP7BH39_9MICO|nr:Lrp/AsnC family transcriptional regulator [Microbacterium marinilacus]MBY0689561.1 Lrp/AsnC family transcriptional regulator [Microbacterium marinilacus]